MHKETARHIQMVTLITYNYNDPTVLISMYKNYSKPGAIYRQPRECRNTFDDVTGRQLLV